MNKTGWIVYEEADAIKNQEYIRMFTEAAAESGVILSLFYVYKTNSNGFTLVSPEHINIHSVADSFTSEQSLDKSSQPAFVINRSRNTELAIWLEQQGVRIYNPAIVTDICNDKKKTYEFIREHGISFMETAYDINLVKNWQYPFVIKPACGHGGNLVKLVYSQEELQSSIHEINTVYQEHPGYVLQHCASDIGKDLRVYLLGSKIIASIMRSAYGDDIPNLNTNIDSSNALTNITPPDIRSNYSLGHNAALHTLTSEENALVQRIIPLLPFDCIGIDFVYDKGHPVFNEIEDAVGARMLYSNSDIDLVKLYMNYIVKQSHLSI